MALANMGRGTGFGMAKELTWGTATARTDWMELVSESMARDIQRPMRPHLVGGSSFVQQDVFDAGDDAGGEIEFEAVFNAICFGHAIYAAFGAVASTGPSGSEYTHTATLATTLPSFTTEVLKGSGSLDSGEVFEGMKCTKLVLSLSPRDVLRCRTSWVGETSGGRTTQGTPTYTSSARPVLHSQAPSTGVTWNSVNFAKLTSFEFTLDNKLGRRNYLGSALTSEPDFDGWRDVMLKVSMHWDSDAMWSGLVAGTSSDATFNIGGTGDDDLEFTVYNCLVESVSDAISSAGVVVQTATLRGRADSSDQGVKLILKNNVAGSSYDW